MLRRFQHWGVLVLLAGAALACALPQAVAGPNQAATPESAATATSDPGRTRVDEGGLSLVLPSGWSMAGPHSAEAGGVSYQLYTLGLDPAASGGPGTSLIIIADAAQLSAEAFVAAQCSTCPVAPFVDTQLGGLPARRTQAGGGGVPFTVDWVFVERGGQLIGLSMRDPETLATLEDVLQSVTFDSD